MATRGTRAPAFEAAEPASREARFLELAFEHGLTQLALLDRDFVFIRVNAAYALGAGRPASDFPGRNHFDLFPSDARAIFEEVVRSARPFIAHARPFTYAGHPERGTSYWDWILLPILDEAGAIEALLLSLNDVTEQERASRALAEQEVSYRTLAENSPDIIARFDRQGRHLYVNRAVERATGLPASAFLGRTDAEAGVPPVRRERWEAALRTVFEEGRTCVLEMEFASPAGARTYQTQIVPEFGADGTVRTALSISRDLTDLRQAEAASEQAREALAQSEARFRSLIEHASDLIAILDPAGTIRYASPSFERILGYDPAVLLGTGGFALIHEDDRDAARARVAEAVDDPSARPRAEYRCRHKDGSWRTLESTVTNLLHEPAVAGLVINTRDITDRVRLQEQYLQAQKMDVMGKLAGGIAHDFNNLLSVIRANAGFLLEDLGPEDPRRADAGQIALAAEQATSLTRQLLAFSRRQVLQPRLLDANAVLAAMEKMLRRLLGEDVEMVTVDCACAFRPLVRVDPGQLEQIIVNLCVNARQAMPDGGMITITADCVHGDAEGAAPAAAETKPEWVELTVTDTGTGMSADVRARIFEPFFTTKTQGTGLGLATVYGIVQQSGGRISVDSAPGRGTTFRVLLPWAEGTPVTVEGGGAAPEAQLGETVLIVEDAVTIRQAARRILERCGYAVVEAADGDAALRHLADARRVDLVLSDVVMPHMTGLELADSLARSRPDLPVVLMTGYAEAAAQFTTGNIAGLRILQKPFTPESLARQVRRALDEAEAARRTAGE